eukprot:314292-Pleurochrysis_carterae.AAC.1
MPALSMRLVRTDEDAGISTCQQVVVFLVANGRFAVMYDNKQWRRHVQDDFFEMFKPLAPDLDTEPTAIRV